MKKSLLLILFSLGLLNHSYSQTLGLLSNTEDSYQGYTLWSPDTYPFTYLIDNCGEVVHQWEMNNKNRLIAYLTEEGNLVRSCEPEIADFGGGGAAGAIEILSWEGDVLWNYQISDNIERSHHDIEILPNGNILAIVWTKVFTEELNFNGMNPDYYDTEIWIDRIIEIEPVGSNEGNIVWEWNPMDHLIQDYDSSKENFGVISEHPEKININHLDATELEDWMHTNSVDYNEQRDEIMLSVHDFNEIWIIDHNTTTEEAAGEAGDLLYRWGNPEAYDQGTEEDRMLFLQHDARWIDPGVPGAGRITVYNNGLERTPTYSEVMMINAPFDNDGNYLLEDGTFGPDTFNWVYGSEDNIDFFSARISGASRLPNGNYLICEGMEGRFFEVTVDGEVVWEYINPVGSFGPLEQDGPFIGGSVFRVARYSFDYPAFEGKDLTPQGPLELNPYDYQCVIWGQEDTTDTTDTTDTIVDNIHEVIRKFHRLAPNPSNGHFNILSNDWMDGSYEVQIHSLTGVLIERLKTRSSSIYLDIESGTYVLSLINQKGLIELNQLIIIEK